MIENLESPEQFDRDFNYLKRLEEEAKKRLDEAEREYERIVAEAKAEAGHIDLKGEQLAEIEAHEHERSVNEEIENARREYDKRFKEKATEIRNAAKAREAEAVKKVLNEVLGI